MSKKSTTPKQAPAEVIRRGETTASVYLRQSPTGYRYFDFVLGRHWKSILTGKEISGNSFFDRNEEDLVQVVRAAVAWIRQQAHSAPAGHDQEPTEPDAE